MSKSRPGGISQHCPQLQREWRTTGWERPSLRPLLAWWPRIRCSLLQLAQIWTLKRNNWCFMVINGWQEVKLKHCTVFVKIDVRLREVEQRSRWKRWKWRMSLVFTSLNSLFRFSFSSTHSQGFPEHWENNSSLSLSNLAKLTIVKICSVQRDGALPVRQLASVLLKQYIDVHWSPDAARYQPFKSPDTPKNWLLKVSTTWSPSSYQGFYQGNASTWS